MNGGGGFGSSTWDTAGCFNTTGGLVGGTLGYNYQIGHAVLGAEGDIDWASINGTTTTGACPAGCTTSNSWLSTVRGRVGYAADRFLPYVTGGGAFGNINATTAGLTDAPRPMQAGPSAPASNSPSPAIGRPKRNISTSISANSIAAPTCGARDRQRVVHAPTSFVAASTIGSERVLRLSVRSSEKRAKPRGESPGAFLLPRAAAAARPSPPSRRMRRHARGEAHRARRRGAGDRRANFRQSADRDNRARRRARSGRHLEARGLSRAPAARLPARRAHGSTFPAWCSNHFGSCFSGARQRPS